MEIEDLVGAVLALVLGSLFIGCVAIVLKLIWRGVSLVWGLI